VFSFLTQPNLGGGVVWKATTTAYRRFLFDTDFLGRTAFDASYLRVFGVSFVQAGVTTVACLLLAFPLALWMANRTPRAQTVLVLLVTIPFWTNLLVRTYAWMLVLNDNGIVNRLSRALGLGGHQLLYTQFASGIGLVYTFLPFMVLPIYATLERFDFRLAEAAYDLGARKPTVIRRVIYPAARVGIVSGVFLVFIPALGSYVQPALLGGGKSLLVGNLIAQQYGEGRNWPFGSALAVILLVFVLVGLLVVALWSRRTGAKVSLQ
jgi:spermidine/putrescine transport system permease protein